MPAKGLASTSISGSDSEKKLNSFLTIVQTQKCDCDTYPMYTLVQTHKCACDTYPMYNLTINIKITTKSRHKLNISSFHIGKSCTEKIHYIWHLLSYILITLSLIMMWEFYKWNHLQTISWYKPVLSKDETNLKPDWQCFYIVLQIWQKWANHLQSVPVKCCCFLIFIYVLYKLWTKVLKQTKSLYLLMLGI